VGKTAHRATCGITMPYRIGCHGCAVCSRALRLAGCHGCAVCSRALRPTAARLLNGATVAPGNRVRDNSVSLHETGALPCLEPRKGRKMVAHGVSRGWRNGA